jgi:hypothetical protein
MHMFEDAPVALHGKIGIRVFVLPRKQKALESSDQKNSGETEIPDLESDEYFADSSATTLGSYLESSRGKRCCVFLVNGQRQDSLDNSFIVQDLGFKYLRNRMMIMVDVDGLSAEAIGRLMQGSRQGFYRGDIYNAVLKRVVATLKNDPDLLRLEEEAEEQISELRAGDEKVRQALDELIDAHHLHGSELSPGTGTAGQNQLSPQGILLTGEGDVVSLLTATRGESAAYPVLVSQPANSSVRLRPNQSREVGIKSLPSDQWHLIESFAVAPDASIPELEIETERLNDHAALTMLFRESDGFDTDQYPIRATINVTAKFKDIPEPRQVVLQVLVKPDIEHPDPILLDAPTKLTVSSREPIQIKLGPHDTHVRLRWDGKDSLLTGGLPSWTLAACMLDETRPQPSFHFSQPNAGRFSLLIGSRSDWQKEDRFFFEVTASGPDGRQLTVRFRTEVIESPVESDPEDDEPRLIPGEYLLGAGRRPPYQLKVISRDQYEDLACWNAAAWTDNDPGCFEEPTERAPLTLIINEDMSALSEYRRSIVKRNTEQNVQRKISKYTSHVAYHLYQMYQASAAERQNSNKQEVDLDGTYERHRGEIHRVSMTLIKLMDVGS